jgi:N-methylhydantoinase B
MSPAVSVDPFTFQIVRHKLNYINEEGIIALENVSGSPITTEGHDMMVSLYTKEGELLLGGVGFLHHLTSAAQAVKHIIGYFGLENIGEDDVFFFNDSYTGALHPPDVFMISPIHFEGELQAFSANFVHMTDIGAIDPGGFSPNARETYHEGFQTKGLKLVDGGVVRFDVMDTLLNQVRDPAMCALDIQSQLAANHVAKERMKKLFADYGVETVDAVSNELIRQSEELTRQRLLELPDGEWTTRQYVDSDGGAWKAELKMTKEGDRLVYDFTGSDPQAPIGINCSYWATWGGMFAPIFPLLAWDITWNVGVTRPIELIAPEGTVVNCTRPAPLSIATVSMINIVNNLSSTVLSKMLGASEKYKNRATAVWYGSHAPVNCHGTNARGEWYNGTLTDAFAGGGGGRAFADGVDMGGEIPNVVSRWGNVEHHELRTPLLYLYRRVVPDSGGPGKYRGGMAHEYAFTPHGTGGDKPMNLLCFGKGAFVPMSTGLFGGHSGCHHGYSTYHRANVDEWPYSQETTTCEEREDRQWGSQTLHHGDIQYLRLCAGGGYGDPLDREASALVDDVLLDAVSRKCAAEIYGVVLVDDEQGIPRVDEGATTTRRLAIRAERLGAGTHQLFPQRDVVRTGRRMSEYLQRADDGSTQCTWCGHSVAAPGVDWKDEAAEVRSRPEVAGPGRDSDPRFELIEFYCPGCATLLDIDLTNGEDPAQYDRIHRWPGVDQPGEA